MIKKILKLVVVFLGIFTSTIIIFGKGIPDEESKQGKDSIISLGTTTVSVDKILKGAYKPTEDRVEEISGVISKYNIGREVEISSSNGEKRSKVFKTKINTRNLKVPKEIKLENIKSIRINDGEDIKNIDRERFIFSGNKFVDEYDTEKNTERAIKFIKGTGISELINGIELYIPLNHESLGTGNYTPFENSYDIVVLGSNGREYEIRIETNMEFSQYKEPNVTDISCYFGGEGAEYSGSWKLNNVSDYSNTKELQKGKISEKMHINTDGNSDFTFLEIADKVELNSNIKFDIFEIIDSKVFGEPNQDILFDDIFLNLAGKVSFKLDLKDKQYVLKVKKNIINSYFPIEITGKQRFYCNNILFYETDMTIKYISEKEDKEIKKKLIESKIRGENGDKKKDKFNNDIFNFNI